MSRRRWLRRSSGVAASIGLALVGCSARRDEAIRFWAMGREGEVAAELVAGFEREHPGLRVRVEQLPWSAAHEKLLTAFAGDATPDVAQMGNTWLPEMAALRALQPLDVMLAASPQIDPADHFAGIWATNRVGADMVGVPWYVDTRLLYYRRDLLQAVGFDEVPTDRRGWVRCMRLMQASREAPVATPVLLPTNEFEPLLAFALQQEGELLRDGGRFGNFSATGFREALDFYLSLFASGLAPGVTNNQVANVWQEFGRGTFAFWITGPWNIGEFKRRLPAALQKAWATAPLPGPSGPGASIAGGSSLVVFRRSAHQQQAWKLIQYLTRPDVQLRFYALTGNLPPRRSTWAMPRDGLGSLAEDRHARAFALQLEHVRAAPAVPEWERIVQAMQLSAAQVVHGQATPDAAVQALDQRVDAMLAKRRWMLERDQQVALSRQESRI